MSPDALLAVYAAVLALAGALLIVLAIWLERPREEP